MEVLAASSKEDVLQLTHQLRVTVKPSVKLQSGQLPQGKMAIWLRRI